MLNVKNLFFKYNQKSVLENISFSVDNDGQKIGSLAFYAGSEKKFFLKSSNFPNLFFLMTEFRYESMHEFIKKLQNK